MGLVRRIVGWIAMLAAGLAIAILAAIVIAPRIPAFRSFLRLKVLDYLNQHYQGHFHIGQLQGRLLGEIAVRDLRIDDRGVTILSASALRVSYRLIPLLRGHLDITECLVDAPFADLRHSGQSRWNIAEAFSSRYPSASGGSALAVSVQGISIREGRASIELSKRKDIRLAQVGISGDLISRGSELRLNLSRVQSLLTVSGIPQLALKGRVSYAEAASGGRLRIPKLDMESRDSHAIVTGAAADLGTNAIHGRIVLQKLASSDVNSAAPQIGLAQDISGAIAVSGVVSQTINIDSALASGGSKINLHVRADLSGAHPAGKLEAQLEDVRLERLLRSQNGRSIPAGALSGRVTADASRLALDAVRASLNIEDRGLSIEGWALGDATLTAGFDRGAANLEAHTQSQSGTAILTAAFDTSSPISYKGRLRVEGFKPQKIVRIGSGQTAARAELVSGDINLVAAAQGIGYRPDTMNANATVAISRSRIAGTTIQSGAVQARIARGILRISALRLDAQQSKLYAHGEIAFAKNARGTIHYTANVADLGPWMSLVNLPGSGAVSVSGDASGNTERLQVRGAAKLESVRFRSYSAQSGRLDYDVVGLARTQRLQGRIDMGLHQLHAVVALKSLQMRMKFEPGRAQHCRLRMDALQDGSRTSRLAADIAYSPNKIEVALSELSLATGTGTWRLINPAAILRRDETVEVRRFRLASGVQQLAIDGSVSLSGAQQLEASVERLDLAKLSSVLTAKPGIEGSLSAALRVGGTARLPRLALTGEINRPRVDQMQYQDVSLNGDYSSSRAAFDIAVRQDSAHWLSANAVLPVAIGWENGLYHRISGDLALRAKSPGIDLSFLDALTEHALTGVRGTLSLDINARGPIENPHPHGYIALHDLGFTIAALDVPVRNLTAQVTLSPEQMRLVYLSARARDGTLGGSGSIAIADAVHPSNLQITFAEWPAINTAEYQATASGTITCTGRSGALRVEGRTEVLHGVFRPTISLTESPSLRPDYTIKVSNSWRVPPPPARKPQPSWMNRFGLENVTLDVETRIHRDTWIENADAQVEIRGELRVFKAPRREPIITGVIRTVQGTLAVAGKTFTVQQGQVLFTGGQEINPSFDIVAKYQVQNYQVVATVTGTAQKPELSLSSVPSLSQSDILSVLVFGKPSSQLTQGQQQGLQQQALSMAGGYAASQLGKAVAQALGLESLGINTAPGGGLGLGTYLTRNLYVSASQESSGTYGHRATMGYYLTPDLELETSTSTTQGNQVTLEWTKEY